MREREKVVMNGKVGMEDGAVISIFVFFLVKTRESGSPRRASVQARACVCVCDPWVVASDR